MQLYFIAIQLQWIYFRQLFIYCIAPTFIYLFYCNNKYLFILLQQHLFIYFKDNQFFPSSFEVISQWFAFRSNRDVSFGLNKNLVRATTINIIYCWRWFILRPFIRIILDIRPGRYYLRIILGTVYFHCVLVGNWVILYCPITLLKFDGSYFIVKHYYISQDLAQHPERSRFIYGFD